MDDPALCRSLPFFAFFAQILTTDSDFLRCAKHLPINLCGISA